MALPANLTQILINGQFLDFNGDPVVGSITFTLLPTLTDAAANTFIIPSSITSVFNESDGSFSITLPASDDPDVSPTGFQYAVTENFVGGRTYNISVLETGANPRLFATLVPTYGTPANTYTPVYVTIWNELTDRLVPLEANYPVYVSTVPEQAANATSNTSNATSNTNTTNMTVAPVKDVRLLPLLVNGATNAS